jgi:hypothetical protein
MLYELYPSMVLCVADESKILVKVGPQKYRKYP